MLNGGAAIAILAFLGAIVTTEFTKWISGIVLALIFYSLGAACSAGVAFFHIYHKVNIILWMSQMK